MDRFQDSATSRRPGSVSVVDPSHGGAHLASHVCRSALVAILALFTLTPPVAADVRNVPDAALRFQAGWDAYEGGRYEDALTLWQPLAEIGHTDAQVNVGVLYEHGQGVASDPEIARYYYTLAAENGDRVAQYNLGMLLLESGLALPGEPNWLVESARQGYPDAEFQLGVLALSIDAGDDSSEAAFMKAIEWFHEAGLGYLELGDLDGARDALDAIEAIDESSPFAIDLRERLDEVSPGPPAFTTSVSTGTGWPVADGLVVTNDHIVGQSDVVTLTVADGRTLEARVVARDPGADLALLAVDPSDPLPPALPLAADSARLGSHVFTIGFPRVDVMGTAPKITDGIVSSESGVRDDPTRYQISVPIQPGNSGGPLLNMRGEVIGVITSMLGAQPEPGRAPQPVPMVNYAVKIDRVRDLMGRAETPAGSPMIPSGVESLESLAERIKRSVLLVRAG